MITFKEYFGFADVVSESMAPDKREVLLAIKHQHSNYQNFVGWLVRLHTGVMEDKIPVAAAWSRLRQLHQNGLPLPIRFSDKSPTEGETSNYKPDGRLATIYKPHLLGKEPDLSQYSQVGNRWVRGNTGV